MDYIKYVFRSRIIFYSAPILFVGASCAFLSLGHYVWNTWQFSETNGIINDIKIINNTCIGCFVLTEDKTNEYIPECLLEKQLNDSVIFYTIQTPLNNNKTFDREYYITFVNKYNISVKVANFFFLPIAIYAFLAYIIGMLNLYCIRNVNLKNRNKNLKEEKYDQDIENNDQCIICLSNYKKDEVIIRHIRCKNYYHKDCIMEWLKTKNICPLCNCEI